MPHWYIAFATKKEFLGGTVVEADTADHALAVASDKGLNPGGDPSILAIPARALSAPDIRALIDRLATPDEMVGMGGRPRPNVTSKYQNAKVVCDCSGRMTFDGKSGPRRRAVPNFVCEAC